MAANIHISVHTAASFPEYFHHFAIRWMANFFDKRSEQARILSLGMKKEQDSFCPALVFS
jgi:hypothetical protein